MISRVAESCFWLNRYMERVEATARMLDVNAALQLDIDLPEGDRWLPLVIVTGQERHFRDHTPSPTVDDAEVVQRYITWDEDNPSSIAASLRAARENARTIRETISLEMWETLNDLWVWFHERGTRRIYDRDRHAFFIRLRDQCLLFHGIAAATMLHEDPFEFMRLGTALERAGQTARVLDVKYHAVGPTRDDLEMPIEAAEWLATLRFCSGVEPFLKRKDHTISARAVAQFLLFDPTFPRSVLHNLRRARNFLGLVRPPGGGPVGRRTEITLSEALDHLEAMGIDEVLAEGLHEVLTWIVNTTAEVCDRVREEFFDPSPEGARAATELSGGASAGVVHAD